MAKLIIRNLSKFFGKAQALDGINLEVPDGKLVVLVGPSGCGKTTLMRCVVGLETFAEGEVYIDDELINEEEPKNRDVAMVFQYYALYPHMTVFQNLSLGLEHTTRLSKEQISKRVEEIAGTLKISRLLTRKPGQLSGGEAQRVAIGRALVRKPKIFLLDEPLSAIDAKLKRELRTEIKKIQRSFGVTTIYVTHDQEEAMAVGDLLVVIRDGRIQQVGPADKVFNSPKNLFVAQFIGKPPMNCYTVNVIRKNDGCFLENPDISYEVTEEFFKRHLAAHPGKEVVLGIRPSSLRILTGKSPDTDSSQVNTATVSVVEHMGEENIIHATLGKGKVIVKTRGAITPDTGDRIQFTFQEDDVHLFDAVTNESLKASSP